jgi:hypothetical protein
MLQVLGAGRGVGEEGSRWGDTQQEEETGEEAGAPGGGQVTGKGWLWVCPVGFEARPSCPAMSTQD